MGLGDRRQIPADRSRVFGAIQIVSTIAATAVLFAPALAGSKNPADDVRAMGWFIVFVTPLGILAASFFTPEKIVEHHSATKTTLRDYWEMVSWPEMRRIVAAAFCLTLGPGWMSAMYLFYFQDSRGFDFRTSTYLLALYIAAGVRWAQPGSPGWRRGQRKHRTLMIASTGYLARPDDPPTSCRRSSLIPAAIIMFSLGFLAAGFVLCWAGRCAPTPAMGSGWPTRPAPARACSMR